MVQLKMGRSNVAFQTQPFSTSMIMGWRVTTPNLQVLKKEAKTPGPYKTKGESILYDYYRSVGQDPRYVRYIQTALCFFKTACTGNRTNRDQSFGTEGMALVGFSASLLLFPYFRPALVQAEMEKIQHKYDLVEKLKSTILTDLL